VVHQFNGHDTVIALGIFLVLALLAFASPAYGRISRQLWAEFFKRTGSILAITVPRGLIVANLEKNIGTVLSSLNTMDVSGRYSENPRPKN
jgi:hypothetical protein